MTVQVSFRGDWISHYYFLPSDVLWIGTYGRGNFEAGYSGAYVRLHLSGKGHDSSFLSLGTLDTKKL
jgi:hypothetical protein